MKVILTKDIKGTGKKGDIINAAEGFARNHLIPKGLALMATEGNLRDLNNKKEIQDKRKEKEYKSAQDLKKRLGKVSISIPVKIGEGGRLFGSITNKDVSEMLESKEGISIDKRKIELESSIKNLGTYSVSIKLHPEVSATIQLHVVMAK
ncbi:MAG: 50S ribosomal protein L9 [Clostridia bacterium]|nr:50S ribosomal protein L9 [Clostridia bacterium]MDD4047401.1 50S ribosomal protein L9 [Clostridia bacterium]